MKLRGDQAHSGSAQQHRATIHAFASLSFVRSNFLLFFSFGRKTPRKPI
jgi:hypothetical protein